jgi:hypothetical protein
MEAAEAEKAVEALLSSSGTSFTHEWRDPRHIATTAWRDGALDLIADPFLKTEGTILIEMELSRPHPDFYGIVRIDERGIWYSDADGTPQDAAWRLRLILWTDVEAITLHQVS